MTPRLNAVSETKNLECGKCNQRIPLKGVADHVWSEHLGDLELKWKCGGSSTDPICPFQAADSALFVHHAFKMGCDPARSSLTSRSAEFLQWISQIFGQNDLLRRPKTPATYNKKPIVKKIVVCDRPTKPAAASTTTTTATPAAKVVTNDVQHIESEEEEEVEEEEEEEDVEEEIEDEEVEIEEDEEMLPAAPQPLPSNNNNNNNTLSPSIVQANENGPKLIKSEDTTINKSVFGGVGVNGKAKENGRRTDCAMCQKGIKGGPSTLLDHALTHYTGTPLYKCSHCPFQSAKASYVKYHSEHREDHPKGLPPVQNIDDQTLEQVKEQMFQACFPTAEKQGQAVKRPFSDNGHSANPTKPKQICESADKQEGTDKEALNSPLDTKQSTVGIGKGDEGLDVSSMRRVYTSSNSFSSSLIHPLPESLTCALCHKNVTGNRPGQKPGGIESINSHVLLNHCSQLIPWRCSAEKCEFKAIRPSMVKTHVEKKHGGKGEVVANVDKEESHEKRLKFFAVCFPGYFKSEDPVSAEDIKEEVGEEEESGEREQQQETVQSSSETSSEAEEESWKCQMCQDDLPPGDLFRVQLHMQKHIPNLIFNCPVCDLGNNEVHVIAEHINSEHPDETMLVKPKCNYEKAELNKMANDLIQKCFPGKHLKTLKA